MLHQKMVISFLRKVPCVVGNQSNKLYYYGLLLTADDYKYQVVTLKDNGGQNVKFIINSNGSIQHPMVQHTKRMAMS